MIELTPGDYYVLEWNTQALFMVVRKISDWRDVREGLDWITIDSGLYESELVDSFASQPDLEKEWDIESFEYLGRSVLLCHKTKEV